MLYTLKPTIKNGTRLNPQNTYYTEEYARTICNLYMTREVARSEQGDVEGFYRLHATTPHTVDKALQYDIKCPKCPSMLKQIGHCLDHYELGSYACPVCDIKKGGI